MHLPHFTTFPPNILVCPPNIFDKSMPVPQRGTLKQGTKRYGIKHDTERYGLKQGTERYGLKQGYSINSPRAKGITIGQQSSAKC